MSLTNAFYEAVQTGNVRRVRIMMQDSLLIDPTFNEFEEMEKAASLLNGLYDEHDNKDLILDKSLWDDDYMDKVMVKVNSNFSRERIEHLKQVIKYLRPMVNNHKKDESLSQTSNVKKKSSYQEEKRKCQERGEYLGASVGVGAVVGATIGGTVAYVACASTSAVVSGVVAGAVVGGAIASYITKGSD